MPTNQQIDVMCGESGYATTWVDESTQGKYLARLFLFDVMSGVPLTIWYDWHDDGLDPLDQEQHFGIVRHDYLSGAAQVYDPKPAYDAAMTYSHELEGFRFKERVKTELGNDFILSFAKDATQCLVAWTSSTTSHEVKIRTPDGIYTATSYDGKRQMEVATSGGIITLKIDVAPQYFKRK